MSRWATARASSQRPASASVSDCACAIVCDSGSSRPAFSYSGAAYEAGASPDVLRRTRAYVDRALSLDSTLSEPARDWANDESSFTASSK